MFNPPHSRLVSTPCGPQLSVHGKPFLCLPGELQNSSFSSVEYMSTQWSHLKSLHINTLLASVSWELIEPREGEFDFEVLDQNILNARAHGFKLILLWFGSYKNGRSTYVPPWVKVDSRRFPRVKIGEGKLTEVLSPFCERNWEADARAYAKFMEHLKEIDEEHATVIMVQVQNEPGLLGDSMDRSELAREQFEGEVPGELLDELRSRSVHPAFTQRFPHYLNTANKTWEAVFHPHAQEAFMANALSRYVDHIASIGKTIYPLPTFINTWLNADDVNTLDLHGIPLKHNMSTLAGGGSQAGDYPSGGACPHVLDIWKFNTAKSLEFLAPDVYLHDYQWVCDAYTQAGNPLFIPEQRRDEYGLRRLPYAYLTHHALGCSPFGIDTLSEEDAKVTAKVFGLLSKLQYWILDLRWRGGEAFGFWFDEVDRPASRSEWVQVLGEYEVTITRAHVFGKPGPGFGLIILLESGAYLVAGEGFNVAFKSINEQAAFTGIATADEKVVDPTTHSLTTRRRLNGDETMSGEALIMPNDEPDYGGFPIAITVPAETYVVECVPYWIADEGGSRERG